MKPDNINPHHYRNHSSGVECIDITAQMDFCLGNAFKYLFRCGDKGDPLEDLLKARWYVNRALADRLVGNRFFGWTSDVRADGYEIELDAPENVRLVVYHECRYSGHMAKAMRFLWTAGAYRRSVVPLEHALEAVERMIDIEKRRQGHQEI